MNILFKQIDRVLIAQLNRPKALNALNSEIMHELLIGLEMYDLKPEIGCIVLTGNEDFFCAGADIKEMISMSANEMVNEDYFNHWERLAKIKTPIIAAVAGYAYGGGCELAMMADILYTTETSTFSQPEIKLGVIPGIGGTQRLTKLVGKSKAMDIILTGRNISAEEAYTAGLVSRIFPKQNFMQHVMNQAQIIANFSKIALKTAKETINQSLETGLNSGIVFERKLFHSLFNTSDQKEGMNAFIEKRVPQFNQIK
ncbi:enoyl-CoA hydratase [Tenacibaculum sp. Bg11-29]|uniref:enoyl-CoA hydratase-related protein n=1 Tax=Tenacibaculum sp. Bg11-29 TaxID=2058306 RepID=UPI000C338553|nr:enoyl-CoA hydratase-related protein [Tenacibaculum sp. Bg11-29]PKH51669.1 enoyl-CoA hydratase [Tenacibaculum sp. Bg11-29]